MDLRTTQLKDTYGNLLTIGTTAGSPTTGTLQNGDGEDISILTLGNSSVTNHQFILQDSTTSARLILSSGDLYIDGDVDGVGNRDIIFRVDGGDESMRLESNGDISFQDTSNNEAFYWDASAGSLGLGTTSPANLLHIQGSSDGGTIRTALFENVASLVDSKAEIMLVSGGNTNRGSSIANINESASGQPASMVFSTSSAFANPTERMRITSDGYVGIGTGDTDVQSGDLIGVLAFNSKDISTNSSGAIGSIRSYATTAFNTGAVSGDLRFYTQNNGTPNGSLLSGTERMRIDSSGNLLVGKTASGVANDGFQAYSAGYISVTDTSFSPLILNRKTTNGDIVDFQKDGTSVGSIGTTGGDLYFADASYGGIKPLGDGYAIVPSTNSGADYDNAMSLGASSIRWKDLYLGGSVYLGGTTSANALDDYEEGTWTPAWNFATSGSATLSIDSATYTKIGRVVNVNARIFTSSISSPLGKATLTGLPFTANSAIYDVPGSVAELFRWATDIQNLKVIVINNQSYLEMTFNSATDSLATDLSGSDFDSGASKNIMSISVTYFV